MENVVRSGLVRPEVVMRLVGLAPECAVQGNVSGLCLENANSDSVVGEAKGWKEAADFVEKEVERQRRRDERRREKQRMDNEEWRR